MDKLEQKRMEWIKLVSYESPHGSIIVKGKERDISKRSLSTFTIEFIDSENRVTNIGTRRSAAYALKQLLHNFGEYTEINQYENLDEPYNARTALAQGVITRLRSVMKDSNFEIVRENIDHSLRYKICYKSELETNSNSEQPEM